MKSVVYPLAFHLPAYAPRFNVVLPQKGDHIILTKPGIPRPVVITTSPRKVPVTHIRTNLTTAGISRDMYFELLKQVK